MGFRFVNLAALRRHFQASPVCCRAVEWGFEGLLPPDLSAAGHVQGITHDGIGTGHLPSFPEDVSPALLARLRGADLGSDTEIFDLLIAEIEPFPILRSTLDFWAKELTDVGLAAAAQDVLLCFQVDLWCDSASRLPRTAALEDLEFRPVLFPLVRAPSPALRRIGRVGPFPFDAFSDLPLLSGVSSLTVCAEPEQQGLDQQGLYVKGPKPYLCSYLANFVFILFCFVFFCLYLSLFVFVCLLFVTASCCSTWDLASSSTSTIHRRGLSPPWCEFVF